MKTKAAKRMIRALAKLLFLVLLLTACSARMDEEILEEIEVPDMVVGNFHYIKYEKSRKQIELKADTSIHYEDRILLTNPVFTEYNNKGKVISVGRADSAEYHPLDDTASFSGNIVLTSSQEDATIRSQYLEWSDPERYIKGSSAGMVQIDRGNGTSFQGSGFSVELKTMTVEFAGDVEGVLDFE